MILGKRKIKDLLAQILIYLCAAFSVAVLLLILCFVVKRGVKSVNWSFLTTVTSVRKQTVGIAGNILNTVLIILVSMLIATPIGVGAAIFLNEYAGKGKTVRIIEFTTEVLAGIPSIIFGLFGMLFFGETNGLYHTDRFADAEYDGTAAHYEKYTGSPEDRTGRLPQCKHRPRRRKVVHDSYDSDSFRDAGNPDRGHSVHRSNHRRIGGAFIDCGFREASAENILRDL